MDRLLMFCRLSWEYLFYVRDELKNLRNIIAAAVIGGITIWLTGEPSLAPFLTALTVLLLTNALERVLKRDANSLLLLPGKRDDPAFIMDHNGLVIQATGKTRQFLERNSIVHVSEIIGQAHLEKILANLDRDCENPQTGAIECYSDLLMNWYEVKFQPVYSQCGKLPHRVLVWFNTITARKELELRQHDLLNYSDHLISNIKQIARKKNIFEQIATCILGNYRGVFISRQNSKNDLVGYVFKHDSDIVKSGKISISKESIAPVFLSRRLFKIISDQSNNYASTEEFLKRYPFDERVRSFLDQPIYDFINYHAGDVSVIAFNSIRGTTPGENSFVEILLNMSRSIVALVDLARENEEQFLQKVMGLCAAAEYSDEITGKHILRVNAYSRFIAQEMGFDSDFTENIGRVAALHDIGKVAIPELIKLPRPYTPEERLKMQMHTIYGASIIQSMMEYAEREDPRLVMAYNIALHHHQTYNGKGYPKLKQNGIIQSPLSKVYSDYERMQPLAGKEIPIEGLIVGLSDRYDALRSQRPYKEGYTHEKAVSVLSHDDHSGQKAEERFGKDVWAVFERRHIYFRDIYESMQN
jgi:HD-GYP domain-containing protein (c-di-GMP phosphodiesterase class II)